MIFLGICLIISAAIIAVTVIVLFNKAVKMYKEIYNGLFKEDDLADMLDNNNDDSDKKIVDIDFGGF